MNAVIKLMVNRRNGAPPTVIILKGDLDVAGNLTPHEIAGVFWSCEFAINNHAGEIMGNTGIRAHMDLRDE